MQYFNILLKSEILNSKGKLTFVVISVIVVEVDVSGRDLQSTLDDIHQGNEVTFFWYHHFNPNVGCLFLIRPTNQKEWNLRMICHCMEWVERGVGAGGGGGRQWKEYMTN